jgi:hypothetical protein
MVQKMKKFCKISKYLEIHDKQMFQVFDDLCLFPLLRVRNRGVTFLRPVNKEFRTQIINATYSQSPETAVDIIKTLILYDFLLDAKSSMGRTIPNASKFKLEIEKIDGKKLILKSKHVIEPDNAFKTLRHGDLAAVWTLSGTGGLPLSGKSVSMDDSDRKVSGGAMLLRETLGKFVENTYQKGEKKIYRATMACLYKYAATSETEATCKLIVDTMCATARASFYVIVEPYADKKLYNVFDELINKTLLVKDAYPESVNIFDMSYEKVRNALIKKVYPTRKNRNTLVAANDVSRKNILSVINQHTLKRAIENSYNDPEKFAKDAFTMYCFLSTRNEEGDSSYYKNCFCYVVRNLYKTPTEITSTTLPDVAFTMSIYGNLLKSDAFKYVPFLFGDGENEPRIGYEDDIPSPTDLKTVFTIEQNELTNKQGGGSKSVEELENFINN